MLREVGRPRKSHLPGRPRKHALIQGTSADRSITHGAGVPKAVLPHRNKIESRLYKFIFNSEVHLTTTDALLVQQLARDLAIQDFYWEYFNRSPEKWIDSAAHKAYYTGQKNITRIASELGLSTSTKIKLGIDIGRLKQASAIDDYQSPVEAGVIDGETVGVIGEQ